MDLHPPNQKIQEQEEFIWSAEMLASDGEISIAEGISLSDPYRVSGASDDQHREWR